MNSANQCKACEKQIKFNHGRIRIEVPQGEKTLSDCYVYCPTKKAFLCNFCSEHPFSAEYLQIHFQKHFEHEINLTKMFSCQIEEIPLFIYSVDKEYPLPNAMIESKEDITFLQSYFVEFKQFKEGQNVIYFKNTPIPVIGKRLILETVCNFCRNKKRVTNFRDHLRKKHFNCPKCNFCDNERDQNSDFIICRSNICPKNTVFCLFCKKLISQAALEYHFREETSLFCKKLFEIRQKEKSMNSGQYFINEIPKNSLPDDKIKTLDEFQTEKQTCGENHFSNNNNNSEESKKNENIDNQNIFQTKSKNVSLDTKEVDQKMNQINDKYYFENELCTLCDKSLKVNHGLLIGVKNNVYENPFVYCSNKKEIYCRKCGQVINDLYSSAEAHLKHENDYPTHKFEILIKNNDSLQYISPDQIDRKILSYFYLEGKDIPQNIPCINLKDYYTIPIYEIGRNCFIIVRQLKCKICDQFIGIMHLLNHLKDSHYRKEIVEKGKN